MPLRLHGFADFANYELPEIGLWVTSGKTQYEYMYSGLPLIADIARSAFHRIHAVFGRAMPCSAVGFVRSHLFRRTAQGRNARGVGHPGEGFPTGSPASLVEQSISTVQAGLPD